MKVIFAFGLTTIQDSRPHVISLNRTVKNHTHHCTHYLLIRLTHADHQSSRSSTVTESDALLYRLPTE